MTATRESRKFVRGLVPRYAAFYVETITIGGSRRRITTTAQRRLSFVSTYRCSRRRRRRERSVFRRPYSTRRTSSVGSWRIRQITIHTVFDRMQNQREAVIADGSAASPAGDPRVAFITRSLGDGYDERACSDGLACMRACV